MQTYKRGLFLIFGSALCLSTSGIGVRLIENADGWQILFYRCLTMIVFVGLVLFVRKGQSIEIRIKNFKKDDLVLAFVLGTSFMAYIFALLETTIANAMFVFSSAPFFAAIFGWVILKEKVAARTWMAIAAAATGLMIMVGAGLIGGRFLGNLISLWLPLSYAISIVLVRRSKQPDMLLALFVGAIIACLLTIPFVENFMISKVDFGVSIYLGLSVGAGFTLFILGSRYVPAAQVGLIALVEPVLAPIWAWIFVSETPVQTTLVGGVIILLAVGTDGVISVIRSLRK